MRIGLIDVDGHHFPNLALMKLSAYHKEKGDSVEWYEPLVHGIGEPLDVVYMAKVFSFTEDFMPIVRAMKVVQGGTGYCIRLENGREVFNRKAHWTLPEEIEHVYPDYSIYFDKFPEVKNTAYGYLSRGCPRGCSFCHVAVKEGGGIP